MESNVEVRVLFFAKARELAGQNGATVSLPSQGNGASLRAALERQLPALRGLGGAYVLALNEEYVEDAAGAGVLVKQGDELAVIPPISGG